MDLEALYKKITDISQPICAKCTPPFNCCAPVGCNQAMVWARSIYGVHLEQSDGCAPMSTIPYLTKTGCTVAPHHRPLCSLWLCPEGELNAPDEYWQLKAEITKREVASFQAKGGMKMQNKEA